MSATLVALVALTITLALLAILAPIADRLADAEFDRAEGDRAWAEGVAAAEALEQDQADDWGMCEAWMAVQ